MENTAIYSPLMIPEIPLPLLDSGSRLYLYLSILLFVGVFFLYKPQSQNNGLPLPAGPKPVPIIGNIHQVLKKSSMECFKEWHKKFGPIISLRYGQRQVISIGSHDIAHNLLDKRGVIYSSRPRLIMASERMTNGMNAALIPYTKKWQDHHRILMSLLNTNMMKRYQPLQDLESKQVLHELLSSQDFTSILARFSASLVLTPGYGKHLDSVEDQGWVDLDRINAHSFEALSSMYCRLVELFPALDDYIPHFLDPWKWVAADAERQTTELHMKHLQMGRSTSAWNWVHGAMQSKWSQGLSDKELAYIIGTIEQTGYEAVLTVTRLLIKAIVLHPSCMEKAQRELDLVVGPNRLPSFENRPRLVYLDAMINEAMRWQPPTPFAIPHANTQDDEYMGYCIPKDTIIIPNIWVMAFDEKTFPDPYSFRPERWLGISDTRLSSFGYGRRICPGRHYGYGSVFIAIARILWAYNLSHTYKDGKRIEIDTWAFKFAFTTSPKPFEASFYVRSLKHQEIIEKEWAMVDKDIDGMLEQMKPKRHS